MKYSLFALGLVSCLGISLRAAPLAPDPDDGAIKLPPGFRALVWADDLGPLRFLTVSPSGDVYAKTRTKGIIAMRDTNGNGRADLKQEFGEGGGTGIALHGDWLYSSTDDAVYRYKLAPGELIPKGEPQLVVKGLPNGHQHEAKSFTFGGDGKLYVEVGSPSNSFGNPDRQEGAKGGDPTEFLSTHGGFWRFDPDKLNQTQKDGEHFSTGHRHILSVAWNPVSKALFVVMMGRDQLNTVAPNFYNDDDNAERVAEEMHILREGANLGWPFTYYDPLQKARMVAPEYGGDNKKRAQPGKYPDPLVAFPAHWAPLQMAFYTATQFPAKFRGGAFIAFHGSWNRAPKPQKGYNVGFVPFNDKGMPVGTYEVFADGFSGRGEFTSVRDARFRPCGLAVGPDGSLYVADSEKGRIWRIFYTGESGTAPNAEPAAAAPTATSALSAPAAASAEKNAGARLYAQCAACHMQDGTGVPNLQPALVGSKVVSGDPTLLINVLLKTPDKLLPSDRQHYSNQMPSFSQWSDADIAAVLTYVRHEYGQGASAITAENVAKARAANP